MVIWLIGLAGAGKTAIGWEVYTQLKKEGQNVVFLDGDHVRMIMGDDLGHTVEDREINAWRICRLCRHLDAQGIDVICSILSLFPETRQWNRERYSQYFEVYIDVPMEVLSKRDQKGLYSAAQSGTIKNVVGFDIPFDPPRSPDMVINNSSFDVSPKCHADAIVKAIDQQGNSSRYPYVRRNLLSQHYDYMYTPYGGESFLRDYLAQRRAALRNMGSHLPKQDSAERDKAFIQDIKELFAEFSDARTPEVLPNLPGKTGFVTRAVLSDLLQLYLESLDSAVDFLANRSVVLWINALVKRFEVSKKLYERYTKELKADIPKKHADLMNYALLGTVLLCVYKHTLNPKYLNSVHKLVDLLCSVYIGDEEEVRALLPVLIRAEVGEVQNLFNTHEVVL
ncbi:MAG TPA: adenylyl-sulfate kinase [Candidatus Brocadiales bacterium]|nr:adenylyl-sulfate kinase [Candidatus Brocadiales bacterium]